MEQVLEIEIKPMLLFPKDAMKLIGLKTTAFHEIRKRPDFPKPKYPTGRCAMYLTSEIEEWIKNL